jgi:signal transduction histidine kinase
MPRIRTRARAVDMLGRQQIAGIQNAISELFKNAHDAYATLARIDYFEAQKLLVIRDNGVGMTKKDFVDKWLVLGTESKLGNAGQTQYRPPEMEIRAISGEKGIGRLAIALLGRMVFVLSRAQRENGFQPLVMGVIHWGLFEMPGINLEEIEVPVDTIPGGKLPSETECGNLIKSLLDCIDKLEKDHPELNFSKIRSEAKSFLPDPIDLDEVLRPHDDENKNLSLLAEGTGTHFIIAPVTPILDLEISTEDRTEDFSFRKHLLGFYNEVFSTKPPPVITTSFRHWRPGAATGEELLSADHFFSATYGESADAFMTGRVDNYGHFKGSLRVYNKTYDNLEIAYKQGQGKFTECGPFDFQFGYLVGNKSESLLPPDEYDKFNKKLSRVGGIYIYRDGIRVLPYGDPSVDWLEIEKRRNLGAGYYFFSYRRMFGAVLLKRTENENLVEKAGREGWQQNKAYRQLKDILIDLFLNLAAEFFRKGGTYTEVFEQHQAELRRKAALLEKREKQVSEKKKRLSSDLDKFFDAVNSGLAVQKLAILRQQTKAAMLAAAELPDHDQAAAALIRAEKSAIEQVRQLRDDYVCRRPGGVGLSKQLLERWAAYQTERTKLEQEQFIPFEQETADTLGKVAKQAKIYINQRKRLQDRLKSLQIDKQRTLKETIELAKISANDTRNAVLDVTQRAVASFDGAYRQIETELGSIDLEKMGDAEIEKLRQGWEEKLLDIEQRHRSSLEAARDMLASLAANLKSSDGSEPAEIMEAMDERMHDLEEQADQDFEMVQLGLAVAIINHEFGAAIRNVRRNIQELGSVARGSESIRPLYDSIRSNFEHLDGHLGLFTPLQRRLHRSAIKITGKGIRTYINDLFSNRLERHAISLDCTELFMSSNIECYPSTIYPVFINLVDNAIYWLKSIQGKRIIRLETDQQTIIIANNGPEIPKRDISNLFQRGFTRKPGGRGLGLFIAKKALQKEEMDIILDVPPSGFHVAFRITTPTLKIIQ